MRQLVFLVITLPPTVVLQSQDANSLILPNTALVASSSSVWTSANGDFSMGFLSFLPDSYYVGIWYSSLHPDAESVVWMANRNRSAPTNSTLRFTLDGRLQLITAPSSHPSDAGGLDIIWEASSGAVFNASQAELLGNGNLVLRDSTSKVLWQSFDHPTDTLLPDQNFSFSSGPSLVPWTSTMDPSPSWKYSLVFGQSAEYVGRIRLLYYGSTAQPEYYWSEPPPGVNTKLFNTTLRIDAAGTIRLYNGDGSQIWMNRSCGGEEPHSRAKLKLSVDGNLRVLAWSDGSRAWGTQWRALYLQCDVLGACGGGGVCDRIQNIAITCVDICPLIEPQLEQALCFCREGQYTHNASDMITMGHTSFRKPGSKADYNQIAQKDCVQRCLDDCNCTAASYSNVSSECWMYRSDLSDGNVTSDTSLVSFVKRAAANFSSGGGSSEDGKLSLPSHAIALIVVAASLILLLLVASVFKRHHQIRSRHPTFKEVFLNPDALAGPKRFSFDELHQMTHGFSEENKLGAGGFGSVYKGTFTTPLGKLDVAVKRLHSQRQLAEQEDLDFLAEIKILGKANHPNVVHLMGFCNEGTERLLVYEYVANGSLSHHILHASSVLSWRLRFQIAIGAAMGIEYLHSHCPKKVVHRDIKTDNILLDENFQAKVADCGLSQIMDPEKTHLTNSSRRGTLTYMAPECFQAGANVTEKADAYSYGLVLLELASGRMVTKWAHLEADRGGGGAADQEQDGTGEGVRRRRIISLEHALQVMEEGSWERLVDERLEGVYARDEAETLMKVVFWCLQGNPNRRPNMEELLLMMKGHKPVPEPPLLGLFDRHAPIQHHASLGLGLGSPHEPSGVVLPEEFVSQGR